MSACPQKVYVLCTADLVLYVPESLLICVRLLIDVLWEGLFRELADFTPRGQFEAGINEVEKIDGSINFGSRL